MTENATLFNDCIHELYSELFGEKSSVSTDMTHDAVNGCIPLPNDKTLSDSSLENSTIDKPPKIKEKCKNKDSMYFLSVGETESYFKDQTNIFVRDVFPNNEYDGKPHTSSNISLSSIFDQAGFSPFKYFKQQDIKYESIDDFLKKGGLCYYHSSAPSSSTSVPIDKNSFYKYTAFYTCDLLLYYYFVKKKNTNNLTALDQKHYKSYDDFLNSFKKLPTEDKTEAIKQIILSNLNVIWDFLIDTICQMVLNDEYITKKEGFGDVIKEIIDNIKLSLKKIVFSSIEFHKKKAPTIKFKINDKDETEYVYVTSQSIIASLMKDIIDTEKIKDNLHVEPRNNNDDDDDIDDDNYGKNDALYIEDPKKTCVGIIKQLLEENDNSEGEQSNKKQRTSINKKNLTVLLGLGLIKFSGDTSHHVVGKLIQKALENIDSNKTNDVFYLVGERPLFSRLLHCDENIFMNPKKFKHLIDKIKEADKIPDYKYYLLYYKNQQKILDNFKILLQAIKETFEKYNLQTFNLNYTNKIDELEKNLEKNDKLDIDKCKTEEFFKIYEILTLIETLDFDKVEEFCTGFINSVVLINRGNGMETLNLPFFSNNQEVLNYIHSDRLPRKTLKLNLKYLTFKDVVEILEKINILDDFVDKIDFLNKILKNSSNENIKNLIINLIMKKLKSYHIIFLKFFKLLDIIYDKSKTEKTSCFHQKDSILITNKQKAYKDKLQNLLKKSKDVKEFFTKNLNKETEVEDEALQAGGVLKTMIYRDRTSSKKSYQRLNKEKTKKNKIMPDMPDMTEMYLKHRSNKFNIIIGESNTYYENTKVQSFNTILRNSDLLHKEISPYINYTKLYKIFYYINYFYPKLVKDISDIKTLLIKFINKFEKDGYIIPYVFPEIYMAFSGNIYYYILIALLQAKIDSSNVIINLMIKFKDFFTPLYSTYFLKKEKELYEEYYDNKNDNEIIKFIESIIDNNNLLIKTLPLIKPVVVKNNSKTTRFGYINSKFRRLNYRPWRLYSVKATGLTKKKKKKRKNNKKTIKKKKRRFSRKINNNKKK